jgi:hypothetical protein
MPIDSLSNKKTTFVRHSQFGREHLYSRDSSFAHCFDQPGWHNRSATAECYLGIAGWGGGTSLLDFEHL